MPHNEPLTFTEESFPTRKLLVASLIVFFCLDNFLVNWFMEVTLHNEPTGLLVYGSGGVMYAQFALLGFLLVCLPVRLVVQVLVVCTLGLVFWLSVLFGAFVFDSSGLGDVDEAAKFFPVVVLALATPFALAKYFLGWQFQMDGLARPENSRMSTFSLMAATGLVAVSMAILNSGSQELVLTGLLGAAIGAAVSLIFLLPLAKVVLRSDRPFSFLTLISFITICFTFLLIWGIEKYAGTLNVWVRFGISFAVASFLFWFGVGLLCFRAIGGGLIIERRNAKTG